MKENTSDNDQTPGHTACWHRRQFLGSTVAVAVAGLTGCGRSTSGDPGPQAEPKGTYDPGSRLADLASHVESGYVPGLVAAVWRNGELDVQAFGQQALGGVPMRRDSLFRIASMTKPITAAAAIMLVEDDVLGLDDPVDDLLPELANRRVLRRMDGPLDDTVPARRSITLRDLLTLRFGLGAIMVYPPAYPIQHAMAEAGIAPGWELFDGPADDYLQRLGSLPLAAHPGDTWLYDTGMHVAGILIERASGQSLGEYLDQRIFQPLNMSDTGFYVPASKRHRLVTMYRGDPDSVELVVLDPPDGHFAEPPAFESGSGGLVSCVDDYLAFCQMLIGNGKYRGQRILSSDSVREMTRDQLTPSQRSGDHAALFFGEHSSWALGMAVAIKRTKQWYTPGRFGWDGGYGTTAYTDPNSGLIGVLLTQRVMDSPLPPPTYTDFWAAAYTPGSVNASDR